jgi:alanine racemase
MPPAMPRPIHATIHIEALKHNLAVLRARAQDARVWAVVKANAYGHGIERVFEGLRGADGFALLDLGRSPARARPGLARAHFVARRGV